MKDERRPARNAAANSAARDVSSVSGPRNTARTPLQEATVALRNLLLDVRDELSEESYSWWIGVSCDVFGTEAARLFTAETLRATRGEADERREAA